MQAKCLSAQKLHCTPRANWIVTLLRKFFLPFSKICPEIVWQVQKYVKNMFKLFFHNLFWTQINLTPSTLKQSNSEIYSSSTAMRMKTSQSSENLADTLFRIQYVIPLNNQNRTSSTLNNYGLKIWSYLTENKFCCCCCVLLPCCLVWKLQFLDQSRNVGFVKQSSRWSWVQNEQDTWWMWFVESVFPLQFNHI